MSATPLRLHPAAVLLRLLIFVLSLSALAATVALVVYEQRWNERNQPQPGDAEAFVIGPIGTELAPLVVFEALPDLFPDEFKPLEKYLAAHGKLDPADPPGDWIDQYGFIRKSLAPAPKDNTQLPVGFVLSYHRQGSGAPSPVPFVGLSCAACHSSEVRLDPAKPGLVLYGVGNSTMNLLAFSEAFRGMLVKRRDPANRHSAYVLTLSAVAKAHADRGRRLTPEEQAMTWLWIDAARREVSEYQRVIDEPLPIERLFDPRFMLAGPLRTQPFRSLVRVHLDRPGMSANAAQLDQGVSKIPVVFHQDPTMHGDWAQFDGSVKDPIARSTLAASTAGANVHNLAEPDLAANIRRAAAYTLKLSPPKWHDVFPNNKLSDEQLRRADAGRAVFREHCLHCHGEPDDAGGWTWNKDDPKNRFGTVIPSAEIGTDRERLEFRHKSAVAPVVADKFGQDFRKDHPLATFTIDDLRAPDGYYAGPLGGAFLRAPYLHNASVPTLAELIGIERRRDKFYRGRNAYDLNFVGLESPPVPDDVSQHKPTPHNRHYYFLFDTAERGNSNRGHHYPPWAFVKGAPLTPQQMDQLRALLEYLKTL